MNLPTSSIRTNNLNQHKQTVFDRREEKRKQDRNKGKREESEEKMLGSMQNRKGGKNNGEQREAQRGNSKRKHTRSGERGRRAKQIIKQVPVPAKTGNPERRNTHSKRCNVHLKRKEKKNKDIEHPASEPRMPIGQGESNGSIPRGRSRNLGRCIIEQWSRHQV